MHPWAASADVRKAWAVPCRGHQSVAGAATEHAHHRAHHRVDAGEGSHQSGGGEGCDGHIHLGRSILRGGGWGSARGSGRAGCSLGVQGGISGRNHQWVGSLFGGNGPGRVHGRGRVGSGRDEDFLSWFPWFLGVLTSATQFTLAPLNSRPSSFSTAVFRSLAVSNSTNLVWC